MDKAAKVQYLVNLHTLMGAQVQTSPWLAAEYQRVWDEMKAELKQESDDGREHEEK